MTNPANPPAVAIEIAALFDADPTLFLDSSSYRTECATNFFNQGIFTSQEESLRFVEAMTTCIAGNEIPATLKRWFEDTRELVHKFEEMRAQREKMQRFLQKKESLARALARAKKTLEFETQRLAIYTDEPTLRSATLSDYLTRIAGNVTQPPDAGFCLVAAMLTDIELRKLLVHHVIPELERAVIEARAELARFSTSLAL